MWTVFMPVVFMVGLTFAVLLTVPLRRIRDIKADPTLFKRAAVDSSLFAEDSQQCANNFSNLLQTPVLFYVAAMFALMFGATGWLMGLLCWAYVGLRIAHTLIHIGENDMRTRFRIFAASVVVLMLIWLVVLFSAGDSPVFGMRESMENMRDAMEQFTR